MSGRRGRRPGDPDVTRLAILDAARAAFAEHGYEKATIRAIAAAAGVDPALVHHHFGSKQELFVAAYELPLSPADIRGMMQSGEGTVGERFARAYLGVLSGSDSYEALVRSAVSNPAARQLLREFIERELLDVLAGELAGPDAGFRAALAASHLVGLFVLRRIVGVGVVRDATVDELVAAVSPALNLYLDAGGEPRH